MIRLFSSLKSDMKRTAPFFLEIIKVGAAHMKLFTRLSTPIGISLLSYTAVQAAIKIIYALT